MQLAVRPLPDLLLDLAERLLQSSFLTSVSLFRAIFRPSYQDSFALSWMVACDVSPLHLAWATGLVPRRARSWVAHRQVQANPSQH